MKRFLKWAAGRRRGARDRRIPGVPVLHPAVLHRRRPRHSASDGRRRAAVTDIADPAERAIAERGRYIVMTAGCIGCHAADGSQGPDLSQYLGGGGLKIQTPHATYVSRNLTPDKETGLGRRTDDEVKRVLRSGTFPDGHVVEGTAMPWPDFSNWTEEDRHAVVVYLRHLKPIHHVTPEPVRAGRSRFLGRSSRTTAEKTTERRGPNAESRGRRAPRAGVRQGQKGVRVVSDPDWWVAAVLLPLLVGSQHEHRIPPSERRTARHHRLAPASATARRRGVYFLLAAFAVLVLGGGTALSYYVDALWFGVARLRRRLLENAERPGRDLRRLRPRHLLSFSTARFSRSSRRGSAISPAADPDQRPADRAAGRTGDPADGARRSAARRGGQRRRHDGRMADAGAVLVRRAAQLPASAQRSSIRSSAGRSPSICSRCRRGSWSAAG